MTAWKIGRLLWTHSPPLPVGLVFWLCVHVLGIFDLSVTPEDEARARELLGPEFGDCRIGQ